MKIELKEILASLVLSVIDCGVCALMYIVANGILPLCLGLIVVGLFLIHLYMYLDQRQTKTNE